MQQNNNRSTAIGGGPVTGGELGSGGIELVVGSFVVVAFMGEMQVRE